VARDPWAHRRGEPRVFALFWTLYVLLAVGGSVLWVARFAAVSASYGPAARIMLVVVSVGATILWPMVRLSQSAPREFIASHVLADVFVVLLPVQFVLWPLIILAGWPPGVVAGLVLQLCVWVLLVGAVLILGLSGTRIEHVGESGMLARAGWMLVILLIIGAGPLSFLMYGLVHRKPPSWLPMMSPLTGIPDVTGKGISGPEAPISASQWLCVGAVGAAAAGSWAVAGIRSRVGDRRRRA
jgi:hypothetical protein